jgi:hypothetical protein
MVSTPAASMAAMSCIAVVVALAPRGLDLTLELAG